MSAHDAGLRGSGPEGERRTVFALPLSVQSLGVFVATIDFLVILAASLGSALAYHGLILRSGIDLERYAAIAAISFIDFAAILSSRGAYRTDRLLDGRRDTREVSATWAVVVLVTLGVFFAGKVGGDVSRGAVGLFFAAGLVALLAWRAALARWTAAALAAGALARRSVVLLASRAELAKIDAVAALARTGHSPVASLTWDAKTTDERFIALLNRTVEIAQQHRIDSIVVLADWGNPRMIDQIAQALRVVPLPVYLLPDHNVIRFMRSGGATFGALTASTLQRAPLSAGERAAKRAFDVTLSAIGLVVLSPLLALIALAIRLDSSGPALFRQTRNGFGGRPFRIIKFRTMTVAEDGDAFRQARRDDPRVTRIGRLLRKTSIDELPQLWNVLRGDMSIVGPRPHATAHNAEYQERIGAYAYRHHVKPGLTGWAQVNGLRGETLTVDAMERRIQHDLYYVNHWSLMLDVRIVARTVQVVWGDGRAY